MNPDLIERLTAENMRLREALEGIIDAAGDAYVYSRMIYHSLDEDALLAAQNDLGSKVNQARAALAAMGE